MDIDVLQPVQETDIENQIEELAPKIADAVDVIIEDWEALNGYWEALMTRIQIPEGL